MRLTPSKIILLSIAAIGGFVLICALGMFVWIRGGCGENLNQSGKAFATRVIDNFTEDWDHEAVLELMPKQARDHPEFVPNLKKTTSQLKFQLGDRDGSVQVEGQAFGRFNRNQMAFATATYSSRCKFDWGSITITVDLFKNLKIAGTNDPWILANLRFHGLEE